METVNFAEASKDIQLPLDKRGLAESIAKIDPEIISDYISGLECLKQRNDKIVSILYSHGNEFTNKLIDKLNETELNVLEKMVNILNDAAIIDFVDELTYLSVNNCLPQDLNNESEVSELMAIVDQIEQRDDGVKRIVQNYFPLSWNIQVMNRILLFYIEQGMDKNKLREFLSSMKPEDLRRAIVSSTDAVKLFEYL